MEQQGRCQVDMHFLSLLPSDLRMEQFLLAANEGDWSAAPMGGEKGKDSLAQIIHM